MDTQIKLENISKVYNRGKSAQCRALTDIHLEIQYGEMVAFMGKSGSGKSTLLHILGLADSYTSGTYCYGGKNMNDISKAEAARMRNEKIGFVLQDFALIPQMTVYDNIAAPLYIRHMKGKKMKELVEKTAEDLGIQDLLKKKVSQLSGGQSQRTAIARAIVGSPELILADEPTGALDHANGETVINVLREINKKGATVIITTHDQDIAEKCDHIMYLEDGKLL